MWTLTEKKRSTNEQTIQENKISFLAEKYRLSKREQEILSFVCQGRNTPHIAKTLSISPRTVDVHIRNIYKKFDIHSRQELLSKYTELQV